MSVAAAAVWPAIAVGQTIDSGDTAWMLTSTALVLFMTLPGLALFYAGLVRRRNALSVLMQCFAIACVMSVLWVVCGYSLAFGESSMGGLVGSLSLAWLTNVGFDTPSSVLPNIPESVFVMFQMTFAIITPALIVGAFAERMRFSAMLLFTSLWLLLVYAPVAHWVWGGGWLGAMGFRDFAGGAVVHVTAGSAALVAALVMGNRRGFPETLMPPHNLTMTVTGACMLWVGWFGFNAGSELASDTLTSSAFATTHFAAAAGAMGWALMEWLLRGKPSVLGTASGAIAGLVCITPGAGFVNLMPALIMGAAAGIICYFACGALKAAFKYDDSLDAFGIHGVAGALGAILTGVFATRAAWDIAEGKPLGLLEGGDALWGQIVAAGITIGYCAVVSFIILKILDWTMGLRVSQEGEVRGLDINEHGEEGYIFV
jgi:Amt family ammonium transporter